MAQERAATSTFGELLRFHRLAAGLTQETLAERARMSVDGISALERGHRQAPYRTTIELLARALELSPAAAAELAAAATRPVQPRAGVRATPSARTAQARGALHPTPPGDDRSPHNLPLPLSRFVGRERELTELQILLEGQRIVTLTGTGGIGKTRVALEAAARFVDRREDGVWFANLAPLSDPALVPRAVAAALGLRVAGEDSALAGLVAAVRRFDTLIVLDNCEHLISAAAELAESLVLACPRVRLLATSREPLNIAGERVYRLPSLEVPPVEGAATSGDLEAYSAVALFVERTRSADDTFALSGATAATVAAIVRRLDGIPLAIELAAARVPLLGLEELAQRLDQRFRLLTGGSRTALARHQTLRAAFDWGYELLTEPERALFARLAIFAGGWTLDALEAVCAGAPLDSVDIVNVLISLVDKSLVVAEAELGSVRYRLLETSHAYASEKLTQRGAEEPLAREHARWACAFLEQAEKNFPFGPRQRWSEQVEPEAENVRAALNWAAAVGDYVLAGRLTAAFLGFWFEHAQSEGRRWVESALAHLGRNEDSAIVARLFLTASYLKDGHQSIAAAHAAIALLDVRTDTRTRARAHYSLAIGLNQVARFDEARLAAGQALQFFADAGFARTRWFAQALVAKGTAELALHRLDECRASYEAALALNESLSDAIEAARARAHLASLEFTAGDTRRALELVLQARNVRGLTNSVKGPALVSSAAYLLALGDAAGAHDAARAALLIYRRVQNPYMAVNAILHLATALAMQGELHQSGRLFGFANAQITMLGCEWDAEEVKSHKLLAGALRTRLSPDEFAALTAEGARLDADRAIDEALAASQISPDVSGMP